MKVVGAIETGGTKTVCAVVTTEGDLLVRKRFPTETPERTLGNARQFLFEQAAIHGPLAAIGIGSFGPIDIRPASANYGRVLNTPKPGWAGANFVHEFAADFDVPIAIDTDVNCALIGELNWGAGRGITDMVYITVGTGIGGGVLSNGRLVKGHSHPDLGHLFIPAQENDRSFAGVCPFHGSLCAEGLASGPAMAERWGVQGKDLDDDHRAWELEAQYLAMVCANIFVSTAPRKIILGGGVLQHAPLIEMIRRQFIVRLNEYIDLSSWNKSLDDLIVPAALGGDSGIMGASAIAAAMA